MNCCRVLFGFGTCGLLESVGDGAKRQHCGSKLSFNTLFYGGQKYKEKSLRPRNGIEEACELCVTEIKAVYIMAISQEALGDFLLRHYG